MNKQYQLVINKLESSIQTLSQRCELTDKNNQNNPDHALIKDNFFFNKQLFNTDSDLYLDYAIEIQTSIKRLERFLKANQSQYIITAIERIESQIQALTAVQEANGVLHNEAKIRIETAKTVKAKRYRAAAQNIIKPTQELYKSLSEHHEFERRLLEMLKEKENALKNAPHNTSIDFSKAILTLHQRLGRCRQAISKIEKNIETAERRN